MSINLAILIKKCLPLKAEHSYLFLVLIGINTINLNAQNVASLTISTPVAPSNNTYFARDQVTLTDGALITAESRVYIDPSLQLPVVYPNDPGTGFTSNFPDLDLNRSVGTLPGQPGVTAMGTGSYFIPFDFPTGTSGVAPQGFGLSYAAGSGQGIAGMGWNLSGLSSITRGGKNLINDGENFPVTFTNNDRFFLNGNLLIAEDFSINGSNNTIYHTQAETFSKIESFTSNPSNGPQCWKITNIDGTVIEFGNTADSKINYSGSVLGQSIFANLIWMVNKITDANGNYIEFFYDTKQNTEILLTKIKYAGNSITNTQPDSEINFYYSLSEFPNHIFFNTKELKKTALLRQVEVKTENGAVVRKYDLNYNKREVWEFLTSVEVSNSTGEKINPSLFKYDEFISGDLTDNLLYKDGPNGTPTATFPDLGTDYLQTKHFTDFNGDGLKDILLVNVPRHPETTPTNKIWFCENKGNSIFEFENEITTVWPSNSNCNFDILTSKDFGNGYLKNILFGDLNGDQFEDFIVETNYACSTNNTTNHAVFCQLFLSNPNGSFSAQTLGLDLPSPLVNNGLFFYHSDNFSHKLILADTDGNGILEILLFIQTNGTSSNELRIIKFDKSNNFAYTTNAVQTFPGNFFLGHIYPSQFQTTNQTQIEGLIEITSGNSILYKLLKPNPVSFILNESFLHPEVRCSEPLSNSIVNKIGDFNGDGSADNLKKINGSSWEFIEGLQGMGVSRPSNLQANPFPCEKDGIVYDINQDGKSDYLLASASGSVDILIETFLSTGDGFVNGESFTLSNARPNNSTTVSISDFNFFDIDGDGRIELIYGTRTYSFSKSASFCYLKQIKNGFGHITQFDHNAWHLEGNYTCDFTASDLNIGFVQPLRMVSKIKTDNGTSSFSDTEYSFKNGIINRHGKGFIGFESSMVFNPETFLETETSQTLNNFYGILIPHFSQSKVRTNGQNPEILIANQTSTVQVYQFSTTGANASIYKPYYLKTTSSESNDLLNGIEVVENFTYNDALGAVTSSAKTINGSFYSETISSPLVSGLNFNGIDFLPEGMSKTISVDGGDISSSISYSYDPNNKKLTTQTYSVGNPTFDEEENYTYNNFGNLIARENVAGGTTLTENLGYDNKNKRIISKTNALSQITQITYDPILGLPISQNLPTQLSNTIEYDGWGRVIKTISTNGNITESATTWASASEITGAHPTLVNSIAANIVFKQTITSVGSPTQIKYFDNLGREIISQVESFNGWMWSAVSYDDQGKVVSTFEPYEINSSFPIIRNETSYDALGRVSGTQRIVGSTTQISSYNYSGGNGSSTTTITFPDNTTQTTKTDALGRIDEITDANGTKIKKYYYTDSGNKTRIQTAVNSVLATEEFFDEAGNRTKLIDKQAGTTLYEYIGRGRLIKQTNPTPGAIYEYTYLPDGRVESKSGPEGIYSYEYVTTLNGLNQLKEISGPNGNQILFTYDAQQRLIKKEEIYDGVSYINQYTYDAYGRELTHHYPGNLETKNNFDNKGFLVKIEHANSGQMLWQLDEINSAGLLNKFTLGDANAATLSYTPERLLNVKSTPGVQVYGFDFDAQNGNLLKRQLSIGNNVKEEVFAYDNLERLEQHRFDEIPPLAVTPSPLNISYDPQGKILSKTDAGLDYRYNMNAQLKKIQQQQAAISLNEQNITYTPFRTVNSIEENGIELTYSYGPDQSRYKGIWKNNGTQYRKRIYASGYEINEETVNGVTTTQNISYVSSPGGLCAMYVEENGSGTFYFVHTDHLGSITAVTNANGNVIARQNFDAWGRRRKVQDYSYLPQNTTSTDNGLNNNGTLPKWLYRGYTGHEHLDEFALVNMNARLYDPVVGMFLSPDNYIQAPGNTQNYNRYAYCLNNPLKYTDPSGNFFQLAIIRGGIDAIFNKDISQADPFKSGTAGNNAIKIWHGFFNSPEFIKQLPQNFVGVVFSNTANLLGNVQSVKYYDNSVVVKGNNDDLIWGWHRAGPAMTVGNFVIGDRTIEADPYNPLFQHEFGHVLQSREMHWGYLSTVAIPSIRSQKGDYKSTYRSHDYHPVEQDANRRAFLHFNSKEKGFEEKNGWDKSNPIDTDGDFKDDGLNFSNPNDLEKLKRIELNAKWVDRVGFWMFGPPVISGFFYAHYYNNFYEP